MKLLTITEQEYQNFCGFFADVDLKYRITGPYIGMLGEIGQRNGVLPTAPGAEAEAPKATAKPGRKKRTKKKAAKKMTKRRSKR